MIQVKKNRMFAMASMVMALMVAGNIACTASKQNTAPQTSQAPSDVAVTENQSSAAGNGSIELTWDPNKQSNIAGYRLYYGPESGKYASKLDVGNKTSQKVTGLEIGKTFYFSITAYDNKGNESAFAKEIAVKVKK